MKEKEIALTVKYSDGAVACWFFENNESGRDGLQRTLSLINWKDLETSGKITNLNISIK